MSRARRIPDLTPLAGLLAATRQALDSEVLSSVLSLLPDEDAAARSLNTRLAHLQFHIERNVVHDGWCIRPGSARTLHPAAGTDDALLGLARLVETDGWHRIKICQSPGCPRHYIDLTNGTTRKYCDAHRPGIHHETADDRS